MNEAYFTATEIPVSLFFLMLATALILVLIVDYDR